MRIVRYLPKVMAVLATLMLMACGQTGALYLPEQAEENNEQTSAQQVDQADQGEEQQ